MLRTVAMKMAMLTATALLGLLILTVLGRQQMERVYDGANNANVNAVPSLILLDTLRRSFLQLGLELERRVQAADAQAAAQLERAIEAQRKAVRQAIGRYETDGCLGANCFADNKDKSYLEQEKVVWTRYEAQADAVLAALRRGASAQAHELLADMDMLAEQLTRLVTGHITYNADVATAQARIAEETKREALYLTLGAGGVMLAAIAALGFYTARSVIRQIGGEPDQAAAIMSQLAAGDLSGAVALRPGDQDSMMARVASMRATMEGLAARAEEIGRGNLQDEVPLASSQDRLGRAINDMIRMLRVGRAEDERRNWMKDGASQLSGALTGDLTTEELAEAAISMLGHYLEAGRGVFYLFNERERQLDLIGSYMYTERDHVGARFALGEGAVGQVARERKPIVLALAPGEAAPPITTGTSSAVPRHTYTYPLLHERELIGVVELASHEKFDERKLEFLSSVTGMIAALLYVAEQRVHIRKLLAASEASEQEMRLQSEKLRSINAQMEEQQQQLQQQAEELQQSNAQMEEQQQQMQQQAEELRQSNAQLEQQGDQMRQQNEQLQEARRQEEAKSQQLRQSSQYKSEFLSNMSHELRTPLNSIILLSKMMLTDEEGKLEGEPAKWAQVIHRSGQELLRLINDVLDLSKVEAGHMELHAGSVSGAAVCSELQSMFEHLARDKGLALETDDALQGEFVTDWDKLSQILRNLVANAVKFTRKGGIAFRIERRPGMPLPICLSVRDTGIGIAADKLAVIFEAFQQGDGSTSREFGGTGLGLTISLRFAQLLGGTIEVESTPEQGSTFRVLLPEQLPAAVPVVAGSVAQAAPGVAAAAEAAAALPLADDRHQVLPGDRVILLIDDDPVFCRSLLAMNRQLGYKTLLAHTGEEGLRLARAHAPHGILLDLGLPDTDGSRVLHDLKSDRALAHIPVHIVSARDRDEALLQQGAIGFLQKPADGQRLAAAEAMLIDALAQAQGSAMLVLENGGLTAQEVAAIVGPQRGPVLAADAGSRLEEIVRHNGCRLAIVDLGASPLEDGLALAKRLRAADPALALVFYASRMPDDEQSLRLREYSECVIVKTPHSEQRLLENVERFLRRVPQEQGALQAAGGTQAASGRTLSGRHLLLVDDDPRNLFVLTAALERHGARVSQAVNGRRALEFLHGQPVDMVLMDIMMPEMDGYQAIRAMRADPALAPLPVLALTAKAAPSDQADALAAGADDYLAKPVDYDVLVAKAIKWSGGRQA